MGVKDIDHAIHVPIPGPGGAPDELRRKLDAMPADELAGVFCTLQYLGMREQVDDTWDTILYFDSLPHDQPHRALALVLAVLRSEAHRHVKMELNTKLFGALIYAHGEEIIGDIEAEARTNLQLRWLAGGVLCGEENVSRRLKAIADVDAWRADDDARSRPKQLIEFRRLSIPELARVWLEQKTKPQKDQDDNWIALTEFMQELHGDNPDAVLDMILEILKIETDIGVLAFVSAGPLEDLISARIIDRIEREAAANEPFRDLLRGVWYWNESHDLKKRLDAITGLHYADA